MNRLVFDLTQKQIFTPPTLRVLPFDNFKSNFDIHTNGIMTGSAKNIRREKPFAMHYIRPYLVCDCCGKKINYKPSGSLCEKCDIAFDRKIQKTVIKHRLFGKTKPDNTNLFLRRF